MRLSRIVIALILIVCGCVDLSPAAQEKCAGTYGAGKTKFSLATGSPGELGLLKVLGETFGEKAGAPLCWVKAGSGESLQLLKEKKVDMIMVHAPDAEKKAVADGWAANRILIGSNEFYIVGPAADPAKIAQAINVVDAYTRIASAKAKFFSRGDNSGTHKKEMDAWKKAGSDTRRRVVYRHEGLHDRDAQASRRGEGILHDRQQHLGCRKEEHARSHHTFPGRQISREHLSYPVFAGRPVSRRGDCGEVHSVCRFSRRPEDHPRLRKGGTWRGFV